MSAPSRAVTRERRATRAAPPRRNSRPARPGPSLRLAPEARRRSGRLGFAVVAAAIVAAMVFGVVTLQTLSSQTSFSIQRLQTRGAQLQQQVGELRLRVAQLSSPDRIAREAARLGLRLPDRVQTITVPVPGRGIGAGGRNALAADGTDQGTG